MILMNITIDWLSISIPLNRLFSRDENNSGYVIHAQPGTPEHKLSKMLLRARLQWEHGKGRAPFKSSIHSPLDGWTYFYGDDKPYSLLEITGRGCEELRKVDALLNLIEAFKSRLTRIDIACDIKSDIKPEEFSSLRDLTKFKSGAIMKSETGETVYVGSRTSDRYARVYRYNPPHPRADLLRVEMVCKDERAKAIGKALSSDPIDNIAFELGTVFAWQHKLWSFDEGNTGIDLSIPSNAHQANTERWLLTSVRSAIAALARKGDKTVIVYFLQQIYNDTGITYQPLGEHHEEVLPATRQDSTNSL